MWGGSSFPDFSAYNDATHKIKSRVIWNNVPTDYGWFTWYYARLNIQTDIKDKLTGDSTFKYFEAPEDCFVCAQAHFSAEENSSAENGIIFMVAESKDAEYAYKYSGFDQHQANTAFVATIPLRKGNIVFALSDGLYDSVDTNTWWMPMSAAPAKVPQLYTGAPDWDNSKSSKIDITTPYTMPRDGVLRVYVSFNKVQGEFSLFINDVKVWICASWLENEPFANTCLVRVSTGDVISYKVVGDAPSVISVMYVPLKN